MNPYEGLNLPQLLDLMHALVVPAALSWRPQTAGWLVLLAWFAAFSAIVISAWVKRYRRDRYRREAAALLDEIEAQADADPAAAAARIAGVLKRTALAAYPRTRVASLYGEPWGRFLCESAGNDPVVTRAADSLATAAYDRQADGRELVDAARRWIRIHRA